jgi:UDP-N-acetylglucosamine--N-acetylmuramyl-(pentapeptide) pyrophosphoryl-undecaprenol N-acetylglucosamine transferase
MSKKMIIAGGGTGGHIFPAIAIANALKNLDSSIEILFIGAKGKMEMDKIPQAGFNIIGLDIAGFNRSSLIKNVALPFKLVKSFFQVRTIFKTFKPIAVIGVGGYSTFPVLKFAQSKNIATFLHESNSFAGKSNKLLGKNATKIFVAGKGMEQFFPKNKIVITGNPIRKAIAQSTVLKTEGLHFFGLDENKTTILAVGGSLGANSINKALANHIDQFQENNLQLIWQTGATTFQQYKIIAEGKKNIWCNAFIKEMEMAYAAADIIISRSGAMAVAEICVAAKPTVFVPFPLAAEDHQTINAKYLVNQKAALMIKDSEAEQQLVSTVIALSKDEAQQKLLSNNCQSLAVVNADEIIAKQILNSIE